MTIQEMKSNILTLIEEAQTSDTSTTKDADFTNKLPNVMNYIQMELIRIKKKLAYDTMEVTKDQVIDLTQDMSSNFYQLKKIIGVSYEIEDNLVKFLEDGSAEIYYYVYPRIITKDTSNSAKLDLPSDLLAIMPYGVAGDLLKSDVSNEYGTIYSNRYEKLKSELDMRYAVQSIEVCGGF